MIEEAVSKGRPLWNVMLQFGLRRREDLSVHLRVAV